MKYTFEADSLDELIQLRDILNRSFPLTTPVPSILSEPITELCLYSQRSENRLHEYEIRTIGDLVGCTEEYLRSSIDGLGKKGIADIKECLAERGLKLRQE